MADTEDVYEQGSNTKRFCLAPDGNIEPQLIESAPFSFEPIVRRDHEALFSAYVDNYGDLCVAYRQVAFYRALALVGLGCSLFFVGGIIWVLQMGPCR